MGSTGAPSTSGPGSRRPSMTSPRPSSPSRAADWRFSTPPRARANCGATRWRWTKRRTGSGGARGSPSVRVCDGRCNRSGRADSVLFQVGRAVRTTPWELVLTSSRETKFVLAILVVFSIVSWYLIFLKWWQFRRMRRQADRFMAEIERATRLDDAYHAAMRLPASPYNRLLREGINFFSELKPGGLKDNGPAVATLAGLAVAVPSVMAYNLFVNRLGLFAGELEGFAQEIIGTMAREGRL